MYVMKIAPGKDPKIIPYDCSSPNAEQILVNGRFEPVPLIKAYRNVVPDAFMIINEDGKNLFLSYNPIATKIAELRYGDYIAGTAYLIKRDGEYTTGFDDYEADELASFMEYDLNIEVEVERRS